MKKIKQQKSKKIKIFLLLSTIWLLLIYTIVASDPYADVPFFMIAGVLPLLIGWGIYWVKKN